jgi:hypothetical protein
VITIHLRNDLVESLGDEWPPLGEAPKVLKK